MGNSRERVLPSEAVAPSNGFNHGYTRHFGLFELDLRAGELRRHGRKVKLQEQPFQVLSQLLEKPGEIVTREELRSRLWPADTFVDFDHSLNAAIRRLRDALGDSAENPTFVETVARRGYRFLAPVSLGRANGNGSVETPAALTVAIPASAHSRRWWILAGLAVLVLVVFGVALGFLLLRRMVVILPSPMRPVSTFARSTPVKLIPCHCRRTWLQLPFRGSRTAST
jgi:DNA-binding winged helix-turn-helix (wHTH) protein